eukprot:226622-Chlamydomonas_euryale.AAC.2
MKPAGTGYAARSRAARHVLKSTFPIGHVVSGRTMARCWKPDAGRGTSRPGPPYASLYVDVGTLVRQPGHCSGTELLCVSTTVLRLGLGLER